MAEISGLNPQLFRPEAISKEVREFNEELERQLAEAPSISKFHPQELRDMWRKGEGPFEAPKYSEWAVNRTVSGPAGDITLRTFVPDTARGVYYHIHGGGWAIGSADSQDLYLERIADMHQVTVASVEYRLAPEHPYPAGPDDCEAAALWLIENAAKEFGTERMLIGGESAGANLSVVTLLRLRDRHGFTGWSGANLNYGAYDATMTPSCATWGDRNLSLSTPIVDWYLDHYVSRDKRRDPDVSPLFADLSDLPPALFSVGTLDPLLDDTLFMHARWIAAGNEADLAVYPGGIHRFNALLPPEFDIVQQFDHRVDEFFTRMLDGS